MLWITLCGLAWLFRDFKPGGSIGGLSVWQGWFSALVPLITFGYYTGVAGLDWNKWMLLGGIVLHLLLIISVTLLSFFTDGGFVVAPLLLIGPVCWIIYVAEINKLSQGLQEAYAKN